MLTWPDGKPLAKGQYVVLGGGDQAVRTVVLDVSDTRAELTPHSNQRGRLVTPSPVTQADLDAGLVRRG